jgi:hypothetical protein
MKATRLERAIMSWIADREPLLATGLRNAMVIRREHSGSGSYTYLSEPKGAGHPDRVNGPQIKSLYLSSGAGSTLWLRNGAPDVLEVYAFGDDLTIDLDEFTLSEATSNKPVQPTRPFGPRA